MAPPTVNTNSSKVWVTFRSDGTIAGSGFTAQYRALLPAHSQYLKKPFATACVLGLTQTARGDGFW